MYVNLQKIKSNKDPAQNAYFIMCILQIFNIGTIVVLIKYFLNFTFNIDKNTTIFSSLALALFVIVINYFLLYAKRDKIFHKYETLPPARKTKGQIYFWLYVILSVALLFGLGPNLVTPRC